MVIISDHIFDTDSDSIENKNMMEKKKQTILERIFDTQDNKLKEEIYGYNYYLVWMTALCQKKIILDSKL